MPRIALIPGDGIGIEVVREARRVLEAVSEAEGLGVELTEWDMGAERFLRDGVTITDEEFAAIESEHDAVLLGALGDPRVPSNRHAKELRCLSTKTVMFGFDTRRRGLDSRCCSLPAAG